MENLNQTPADSTREIDFDQSVDELKQLEAEEREKPDNEKIKKYLKEVRGHIDTLLRELDEPAPSLKKIGGSAVDAYSSTHEQDTGTGYIDDQGFVHDNAKDARGNVDNWRTGGNA